MPSRHCHSCGSAGLKIFYELEQIPVNSCFMVDSKQEALEFPRGDLRLGLCATCGFVQNVAFDDTALRYSADYEETQGFSARFRSFQSELCEAQAKKYGLSDRTVLEIGCGKGEFLAELCEMSGASGIGIDPSYRPERMSSPSSGRMRFIPDFYSEAYAHLRADYVCCRHTLEHIEPVQRFVQMIRNTLDGHPDTVVFFEVPGLERVLEERAFWDLYYEHCSYFTLGSLARLFRSCGFEILDLYTGFEDQYLMIEARPGDPAAGRRFAAEDDLQRTVQAVESFGERVRQRFSELRGSLERIGSGAERAVVWGSGSKAVSYLTTLGIGSEIEWIVDINPHKHGKFLAGSGHEIVSPEFLKSYQPDVVIVMNPIYVDEIRAELSRMGLEPRIEAV